MKPFTTYPAIVGALLATARTRQGLDQRGLAEKLGLSQSSWSRIERWNSMLAMDQLYKASLALRTKPSKVLEDADWVASQLRRNGVFVSDGRQEEAIKQGLAVIGFAALCVLLAKLLSK